MGSAVTRLGDKSTGHGCCFIPVPLITASTNVYINNKGCGRRTDAYPEHGGCEIHRPDIDHISGGSTTVFVNGLNIARIGDPIDNGGTVAEGSPNVFVGG